MVLAVDCGYGWTKGVTESGRRVAFPSVVAPPSQGRDLGALSGTPPEWRITVDGLTTMIGDAAVSRPDATRAWDASAADRAGYRALVLGAVALLGASGPTDLRLGLPLTVYFDPAARQALRERFSEPSAVSVAGRPPLTVEPVRVRVLPQGAGAYFAAVAANPALRDRPVGVIDIGHRTTDYTVFARGPKGLAPREDLSGSVDAGMADVYASVRTRLEGQVGKPIAPERVERILRWSDGIADVVGRALDLRPWVAEASAALGERIKAAVRRAWGDELDFLAAVVLAGGGAVALADHIRGIHPAAKTLQDAPFANAVGFLSM